MLNAEQIKESAIALEEKLKFYAKRDPSAAECLDILKPYIEKAKDKQISSPITRLPCGHAMHEGELRQYAALEEAYSDFSFLVGGYDEEAMIARVKAFDPSVKI